MEEKKSLTPQEKQSVYQIEHTALLKKLDLGIMYVIDFPHRKKLPFFSRMALKVISRQGGRAGVRFVDVKK